MTDLTITETYSEAVREGWARRMVAAAGKSWKTHMTKFDGTVLPRQDEDTDWDLYRKCSQVCRAAIGEPCFSLSGRIVGGRPDEVRTPLAVPHVSRKRRTGKR